VEQTRLPSQPVWSVRVEPAAPNQPAAGDAGPRRPIFLATIAGAPEPVRWAVPHADRQ
jgi:hypothetical protein